jgi:hypothetical protein
MLVANALRWFCYDTAHMIVVVVVVVEQVSGETVTGGDG